MKNGITLMISIACITVFSIGCSDDKANPENTEIEPVNQTEPQPAKTQAKQSASGQIMAKARESLTKGDFAEALKNANQCIELFGSAAEEEQEKLESAKVAMPGTGILSRSEEEEIGKRELINDVAFCWFVKAISLSMDKKESETLSAYKSCAKFSYGRVFEPNQKIYFSPAEVCDENFKRASEPQDATEPAR